MSENNHIVTGVPAKFGSRIERAQFMLDIYAATICERDAFTAAGEILKDLEDYFKDRSLEFIYEVRDAKKI